MKLTRHMCAHASWYSEPPKEKKETALNINKNRRTKNNNMKNKTMCEALPHGHDGLNSCMLGLTSGSTHIFAQNHSLSMSCHVRANQTDPGNAPPIATGEQMNTIGPFDLQVDTQKTDRICITQSQTRTACVDVWMHKDFEFLPFSTA